LLLRWVPDGLPRVDAIRIDPAVATFSLAVTLLAVCVAGVVPAFSSAQLDVTTQLRDAIPGTSATTQGRRRTLVVAQVALAVTVVAAAGLLVRSLWRLQDIGVELATDRLVYVPLGLPHSQYADREHRRRFLADLVAQLEMMAGIAAVTPVNTTPFSGLGWDAPTFTAEGQAADRAKTNPTLNLEEIHPNYFRVFEVTASGAARNQASARLSQPQRVASCDQVVPRHRLRTG
jgi:hypothetical protein